MSHLAGPAGDRSAASRLVRAGHREAAALGQGDGAAVARGRRGGRCGGPGERPSARSDGPRGHSHEEADHKPNRPPNRAPPAGGTPGAQAPNRNGRRQAGRSPRVRVADGIYRDHHGLAANVKVKASSVKSASVGTPLSTIPARRDDPRPNPRTLPEADPHTLTTTSASTKREHLAALPSVHHALAPPRAESQPTPPRDGPRRARTDWLARPPKPEPVTVYRMRRPFATCLRPAGPTSRTSGICTRHRRHRRAALPGVEARQPARRAPRLPLWQPATGEISPRLETGARNALQWGHRDREIQEPSCASFARPTGPRSSRHAASAPDRAPRSSRRGPRFGWQSRLAGIFWPS